MKTLIIAVNSKYIHSALAPWYLKAACSDSSVGCGEVAVAEYTINELPEDILSSIYLRKPDVAAFSCYIWNIETVLRVASGLRKVLPQTTIILGGPEVSYDAVDILKEHEYIDYVLAGEGERSFPELIALLERREACGASDSGAGPETGAGMGAEADAAEVEARAEVEVEVKAEAEAASDLRRIEGLAWRSAQGIVSCTPAFIRDLSTISTPYTDEMLKSLSNKFAYFESSRGCPFSCSYCLSSASEGVRFFPLERVFAELYRLVASGVKQIKFVDRTFNVNSERAKAIIRYILELKKSGLDCNFHLEVGADLFDEETMLLLEDAPKGLFQLEAGVQTVNKITLDAVCRKTDLQKLFSNLRRLKRRNNVHIHTDLIAGLPDEDYNSFVHSFNSVYSLGSHQLQLGFLKFLKGTALRRSAADHGFTYQDQPPYEILSGNVISYDELIVLKGIARIVDKFYNSGRFLYSLEYVTENLFSSAFAFYEQFYRFLKEKGCIELRTGLREIYTIFDRFVIEKINEMEMRGQGMRGASGQELDEQGWYEKHKFVFRELLRLDFLASDSSGTLPDFLEKRTDPDFSKQCFDFLRSSERVTEMIPEASDFSAKLLLKKVHFERFTIDLSPYLRDADREGDKNGDSSAVCSENGDSSAICSVAADINRDCFTQNTTAAEGGTVLLFSYISQDEVTGRYPFFTTEF